MDPVSEARSVHKLVPEDARRLPACVPVYDCMQHVAIIPCGEGLSDIQRQASKEHPKYQKSASRLDEIVEEYHGSGSASPPENEWRGVLVIQPNETRQIMIDCVFFEDRLAQW